MRKPAMSNPFTWCVALCIGIALTYILADESQILSTVAAWTLVYGIWQCCGMVWRPCHNAVAGEADVSKMSTAWASQYLRLVVRRLLLTLALSLVLFLPLRSHW